MSSENPILEVGLDSPLSVIDAISGDKLNRKKFAKTVVKVLDNIKTSKGFVLSIEGAWGSGKTSTLALIQKILKDDNKAPVIVHFNPWIIGDRDALLRQFLMKISLAVESSDKISNAKKVAKEIKAYAKVFDLIKLIPGAEPWASIVKNVMDSAGDSVESIASYKTPDIETQKDNLEKALAKYKRPIIVIIDDIDRLFPSEVYEIIRIVKTVGDLPNIGYVLAWDPGYIIQALRTANVPYSEDYLDKIVQIRLPIPSIAFEDRNKLFSEAIERFSIDAKKIYFQSDRDSLEELYFSGLREVLEQPRDVARVINTAAVIEPELRGEIILSDIIGLAALIVKAPEIYKLLRKEPRWFVGFLPGERNNEKRNEFLKEGTKQIKIALDKHNLPDAVLKLVKHLFPIAAPEGDKINIQRVHDVEGRIASPSRLLIALQLQISSSDVSLVDVNSFLMSYERREKILKSLTANNCISFLISLSDIASYTVVLESINDRERLCLDIARSIGVEPFLSFSQKRKKMFSASPERLAIRAIETVLIPVSLEQGNKIAESIASDVDSISVAAEMVAGKYFSVEPYEENSCEKIKRSEILSKTIDESCLSGKILKVGDLNRFLINISKIYEKPCPKIFNTFKSNKSSIDRFVIAILEDGIDSSKGKIFGFSRSLLNIEKFCSIEELKDIGKCRLNDKDLEFPALAAWRAILEEKNLYACDGSEVIDLKK